MSLKKTTSAMLAIILAISLLWSAPFYANAQADISSMDKLGDMNHYNGIVFGDYESHGGDMEGAMAIGGSSKIGTSGQFDFGSSAYSNYIKMGNYENPNNYPTLLLGDIPQVGSSSANNVHAYGGPVVISESQYGQYVGGRTVAGTTLSARGNLIKDWFDAAKEKAFNLSEMLNKASEGTVSFEAVNQYWVSNIKAQYTSGTYEKFYAKGIGDVLEEHGLSSEKVLVINYTTTSARADIFSLMIPEFDDYELVILNFPDAKHVSFTYNSIMLNGAAFATSTPGNALMDQYCSKIVWNFPLAQSINLAQCGVVGSILAPQAKVEADGGSINGMLVSNSLNAMKNGFELHAFYMKYPLFEWNKAKEIFGSVSLEKTDSNGGLLQDAEFTLSSIVGNDRVHRGVYRTDQFGKLFIDQLPVGDYEIEETMPPKGYVLPDNPLHSFSITEGNTEVDLGQVINEKATSSFTIKKESSDGLMSLGGAKFSLYKSTQLFDGAKLQMGLVETDLVSGNDGKLILGGLTEGTYYLLEYEPPQGYASDKNTFYQIKVELSQKQGGLWAPAVFEVNKLEMDLSEIDLSDPGLFDNDNAGIQVSPIPIQDNSITVQNTKKPEITGTLLLQKVDENGSALAGAVFGLYKDNGGQKGDLYNEYTTDSLGRLSVYQLPLGTYHLEELSAPEGYRVEEPYIGMFTIDENDRYKFYSRVTNPRETLDISFLKRASDTGAALRGAEFQLYKSSKSQDGQTLSMSLVGISESIESGFVAFTDLQAGFYYLVESKAPTGYLCDSGTAWQIELGYKDGTLQILQANTIRGFDDSIFDFLDSIQNSTNDYDIEPMLQIDGSYIIENDPETPGSIVIQKQDADTKEALAGVEFELYKSNKLYNTYKTNILGVISINDLPLGDYSLKEKTRLPGYSSNPAFYLNDLENPIVADSEGKVSFELTRDSIQATAYVYNKKLEEPIQFKKQNDNGLPLEGAVFGLYQYDGELVYVESTTSNTSGDFGFESLQKGTYYIVEQMAPFGYELLDYLIQVKAIDDNGSLSFEKAKYPIEGSYQSTIQRIESGEISSTGSIGEAIVNKQEEIEEARAYIQKIDAIDEHVLIGGEFDLYEYTDENLDGDLIASFVVDGFYEIDNLDPQKKYYIIETKAPEGYELSNERYPLNFDNSNEIAIAVKNEATTVVQPMMASAFFKKMDSSLNTELPGAGFMVYESISKGTSDTVQLVYKDTVYSDNDGIVEIEKVYKDDIYYVAEVDAPVNYEPGEVLPVMQLSITDIVDQEADYDAYLIETSADVLSDLDLFMEASKDSVEAQKVLEDGIINNNPIEAEISITKYDENKNVLLEGAVFGIMTAKNLDEPSANYLQTAKTDSSGQITFKGLQSGVEYAIIEIEAPLGYELDQEPVIVTAGQETTTILRPNVALEYSPADLEFLKVDLDGVAIEGQGQFSLYKSTLSNGMLSLSLLRDHEGDFIEIGGQSATSIEFKEQGVYYLVEQKAPDGYMIPNNLQVIQIYINPEPNGQKLIATEVNLLTLPSDLDISNPEAIQNRDDVIKQQMLVASDGIYHIQNDLDRTGSIDVIKVSVDQKGNTNNVLEGVKFKLQKRGHDNEYRYYTSSIYVTDDLGSFAIDNLEYGEYRLEELESLEGYEELSESNKYTYFTITASEESETKGKQLNLTISNKQLPGSLSLKKTDEDAEAFDSTIEGATFALYRWEETISAVATLDALPHFIARGTTNDEGELFFDNLEHGWYLLVEEGSGQGYDASSVHYGPGDVVYATTVYPNACFFAVGNDALEVEITATNKAQLGDARFVKLDIGSYTMLDDIAFDLYRYNSQGREIPFLSNLVTGLHNVTTENSDIQINPGELILHNLPYGDYVLREVALSDEFSVADTFFDGVIEFSIQGPISTLSDTYSIPIFNRVSASLRDLELRKISSESEDDYLPNAQFDLYREILFTDEETGSEFTSMIQVRNNIVTDEAGKFVLDDLYPGTYELVETDAPVGYESPDELSIVFEIIEEDNDLVVKSSSPYFDGTSMSFTIENTRSETNVDDVLFITKRDRDTETSLADAQFSLYRAPLTSDFNDPTSYSLYSSIVSNYRGTMILPDMQEGYYYLEEVKAPDGYYIDTDTGLGAGRFYFEVHLSEGDSLIASYNGKQFSTDVPLDLSIYNKRVDDGGGDPDPGIPGDPDPAESDGEPDDVKGKGVDPEGKKKLVSTGDTNAIAQILIGVIGILSAMLCLLAAYKIRSRSMRQIV